MINKGNDDAAYHSFDGNIFGTRYQVQYRAHKQLGLSPEELQNQVKNELERIDQIASSWKSDSEVSRFNRSAAIDGFVLSKELGEIIALSEQVKASTDGAFDIHYRGNEIDVSAIAKGYAVDRICDYLADELQIDAYLVEIGGEIRARGVNQNEIPWRIAIEKPTTKERSIQQGLLLDNTGVATSGDYRNYFERGGKRYSHTINPETGKPITHQLASITVLNKSAMMADGLATAIMVLGEEKAKTFIADNKLNAYLISRDKDGFSNWHNLSDDLFIKP